MRALIVIVALAALALLAAMQFGLISFDQTRPAVVQAPKFDADVGEVKFGMENRTVAVPTLDVEKADNATQ